MSDEAVKNSGVTIETAGPATIKRTIKAYGTIIPNEERLSEIIPRFPGIVRDVRKRLGDAVEKDELLAVVESNESLQRYEVHSPLRGTVVQRNIAPGGYAREGDVIFTVADLGSVWVDLHIARRDAAELKLQQKVLISDEVSQLHSDSVVSYIAPFGIESTQTVIARAAIPNSEGKWKIGFFVNGEILVEEKSVPVAVKTSAIQTFRDWEVVFMRDGSLFEIAILELGLRDQNWAEVLSGIKPDQRYATEHSFIVKADIGKSGASHDH
jgi:cobalt-zinc-cadmium efflux system membrane fusion protein